MTEQQPSEWALNLVMEAFYACIHDVGNDWTCRDCQALQIDRVAQAVKEAAAKIADQSHEQAERNGDKYPITAEDFSLFAGASAASRAVAREIRALDLSRIMATDPRDDEPTKEE